MRHQSGHELFRQGHHPVLAAFAHSNRDLPVVEIDILYPESDALHQSHAGAIHQRGHKSGLSAHGFQQQFDLCRRQDGWHSAVSGCPGIGADSCCLQSQYLAKERDQCVQGDFPGEGGDLAIDCQVFQVSLDIAIAKHFDFRPMLELQKAAFPLLIGFFRLDGQIPNTDGFHKSEMSASLVTPELADRGIAARRYHINRVGVPHQRGVIRFKLPGKCTPLIPVVFCSPVWIQQITKQQAQCVSNLPELPLFQIGQSAFGRKIALHHLLRMLGQADTLV